MAEPEHGTRSRYVNRGCRCEPCVRANAGYMTERKERGVPSPIASRPPPGAWVAESACRGMDPALFFVDRTDNAEARAVCAECPVRTDCLEYGLREPHGIWGGLNEAQRRRLVRRRRNWANKQKGTAQLEVVS